jgi:hypothetical protein
MTQEEFQKFYLPVLNWLRATLIAHAGMAQAVASRAFPRLPLYFSKRDSRLDQSCLGQLGAKAAAV